MPSLDHVNIHTRDAAATISFLKAVLNAEEGFRPPFDVPGHWLYIDGHPAIHLNVVERDLLAEDGVIRHDPDLLARAVVEIAETNRGNKISWRI